MKLPLKKQDRLNFDEYLASERNVEVRSEFVNGQVYAMAGASEVHNTIAMTFAAAVENNLADACRVWQSDMKVSGETQGEHFAYYPDIMAACGENTGDPYVRTNPIFIVEILSPSTQRVDLKEKFDNYTSIPTLLEYVVVAQESPHVRIFRRGNDWTMESYYAPDTLILESIALTLPVRHIYRRVKREVGLDFT